jgi:hypothetical protein
MKSRLTFWLCGHCFVLLETRFQRGMLSDSESSDDGHIVRLTINEHYAQAYKTKKEREELQKCS